MIMIIRYFLNSIGLFHPGFSDIEARGTVVGTAKWEIRITTSIKIRHGIEAEAEEVVPW